MALGEGNPGGLTACMELMKDAPRIDPQAFARDLQPLLSLDNLGIYGSNIWILYKDLCGEDTLNVLTLFRAMQLGLLPASTFEEWMLADRRIPDATFEGLREQLKIQLPSFNNPEWKPA